MSFARRANDLVRVILCYCFNKNLVSTDGVRKANHKSSATNESIKEAIDSVANLFDPSTKRFIIEHLKIRHGIDLDSDEQVEKKAVEKALSVLFGEAASMILPASES